MNRLLFPELCVICHSAVAAELCSRIQRKGCVSLLHAFFDILQCHPHLWTLWITLQAVESKSVKMKRSHWPAKWPMPNPKQTSFGIAKTANLWQVWASSLFSIFWLLLMNILCCFQTLVKIQKRTVLWRVAKLWRVPSNSGQPVETIRLVMLAKPNILLCIVPPWEPLSPSLLCVSDFCVILKWQVEGATIIFLFISFSKALAWDSFKTLPTKVVETHREKRLSHKCMYFRPQAFHVSKRQLVFWSIIVECFVCHRKSVSLPDNGSFVSFGWEKLEMCPSTNLQLLPANGNGRSKNPQCDGVLEGL